MKTSHYYFALVLIIVAFLMGKGLGTVTNNYGVDVECMIDTMVNEDLEKLQSTLGGRVYFGEETTIKEIRQMYHDHDKADWLLKLASQVVLNKCKIE